MRTSTRRIATGFAGGALAFLLAACGGGGSQGGSTASSGSAAAKQTASAKASATTSAPKTDGTLPAEAVCDVVSKDVVEQAIGKKVYSASNVDILYGSDPQPALCDYYVDKDEVDSIEIKWATAEKDLWEDSSKNLGTSTGGESVRTRVSGLGNGAYKEVGTIVDVKVIGYTVLLKRGITLSVYDNSGLPDSAVLNATKAAIAVVDKL